MRYLTLILLAVLASCSDDSSTAPAPDPFLSAELPALRVTVLEGTKDAPADSVARIRIEARWGTSWANSSDTGIMVAAGIVDGIMGDQPKQVWIGAEAVTFYGAYGLTGISSVLQVRCNKDSIPYVVQGIVLTGSLASVKSRWKDGNRLSGSDWGVDGFVYCKD